MTQPKCGPAKTILRCVGLFGRGCFSAAAFFGTTPLRHAADQRDRPCRPRALQRVVVVVRARAGVGLVQAGVHG